jgi:hypothetical protein
MVLLDVSATGEENLIEQQSGDTMNDLEYRRKQLLKLQDSVIDMEDLSSGVSITDLTLTDFRIDLAQFLRDHPNVLEGSPWGARGHHEHRRRHRARHHLLPAGRGPWGGQGVPDPAQATTRWHRSTWPT